MKIRTVIFVALLAMGGQVQASSGAYNTAAILLDDCEAANTHSNGRCLGYLSGVHDAISYIVSAGQIARTFCVPNNASSDQLRRVFIKYANDNPQHLHREGFEIVEFAFDTAFPCK